MRLCPRCGNEKADASFIGANCGDCHARGRDLAPADADPKSRPKTRKEQAMATEKPPCKWGCGKLLSKGGRWAHEHKACPKRPPGAELPKMRRKRSMATRPRAPKRKGAPKDADDGAATRITSSSARADGCFFCSGQSQALAKDLFARMLRGGMGFDVAAELVRDIVGAMGDRA